MKNKLIAIILFCAVICGMVSCEKPEVEPPPTVYTVVYYQTYADAAESLAAAVKSASGLEFPTVKYEKENTRPTYAFSTSRESIDIARDAFCRVKELTLKLSEVENAAYRLASSIKKTQKRANALKNITIPMYDNLVYTITNALEEKEREEFTRLKVIKRMKNK